MEKAPTYAALLFLILCFAMINPRVLRSNTIDTTGIHTIPNSTGAAEILEGKYQQASNHFNVILQQEPDNSHAHFALGLIYSYQFPEKPLAIDEFKAAIALQPDFAPAHYHLALSLERKGESPEKIIEQLETAARIDPSLLHAWYELAQQYATNEQSEGYIRALTEIVRRNPSFKDAYALLKSARVNPDDSSILIESFKILLENYPDSSKFALDLANIYLKMGNVEDCSDVLEKIPQRFSGYSTTQYALISAKLHFAREENEQGVACYWNAIDSIHSASDLQAIYRDVRYIMTPDEYRDCQETSLSEMPVYFRQFWTSKDPHLATPTNERIQEHYHRLAYANKHYRRHLPLTNAREMIYIRNHPLQPFYQTKTRLIGDKLVAQAALPELIPKYRVFDDQGLIYIRHGKPDKKAFSSGSGVNLGNLPIQLQQIFSERSINLDQWNERDYGWDVSPMNMSWKYYATSTRPEMIFHFIKHSNQVGWILESIPPSFENRETISPSYYDISKSLQTAKASRWAMDMISSRDPRYAELLSIYNQHRTRLPNRLKRVELDSEVDAKTGFSTQTSSYDFGADPLDFQFGLYSFKGQNEKNDIELFFAIDSSAIEFQPESGTEKRAMEQIITFYSADMQDVTRLVPRESVAVPLHSAGDESTRLLYGHFPFELRSGEYFYEIHIKDIPSGKLGVYQGSYTNQRYGTGALQLSDVLLITILSDQTMNSTFTRDGV
ncbi:MAG TPA: GWxTD domain-containing protein, partial [bacterium]|nr:GWxTD domain-containing protein [bacterium]